MNDNQSIQLSDLVGVVRRRGKLMAIVAGAIILAVYWISMAIPNQYSSYATILVEPQVIDDQLVRSGVRDADLVERLGIMTARILSRQRLSRMIDKFELYPEESEELERQEVIDLMRSDVSVEPVLNELDMDRRSRRDAEFNTFKISYRSRNPDTAAAVAQSIANDFFEANIQARMDLSQQSLDFMEDSIESLTQQLGQVEAAIKEVKAENAGRLPEDLATNQRILQVVTGQLRDARRALDVAQSDEAFWKNQVIAAVTLSAPGDSMSPANRLKVLETDLGRMRSLGFTDKHPDVVSTLQEIELLRERIEAGAADDSVPGSFAEQNARSEQQRAHLRAVAAEQEIERLQAQLTEVQERIASTPAIAERLDSLQRRYDNLSESYRDFSARRQEAVVQANLERKQLGEQFRILEEAYPPTEPTSPNRVLLLVVGAIFGLGVGVAVALVAEVTDSTFHRPRDLQRSVRLPVLTSIPEIMLEPDRARRTRAAFRQALLAAVVTGFCLFGGVLTYVYVNGWPYGGEKESATEVNRTDAARRVAEPDGRQPWG
jgi:polysaccharide chain length determinant protein (PEP-CTERM system associated)